MDDDDLNTSEYYRDAQSFRALRKRKSKTDSTEGSGESCSKQNKGVDLLPIVSESKTGRELIAYSPVFIHNCLEKCIGSYIDVREGILLGGRKKFAMKITICPETNFLVWSKWGLKPYVNLFYTVEFVYNGFLCNVNSPITLHFV